MATVVVQSVAITDIVEGKGPSSGPCGLSMYTRMRRVQSRRQLLRRRQRTCALWDWPIRDVRLVELQRVSRWPIRECHGIANIQLLWAVCRGLLLHVCVGGAVDTMSRR